MKYLVFLAGIFLSDFVSACGERSVPIELFVEKSSFSDELYIEIIAPIKHEKFHLLSAQFNSGDNMIPMYGGYREDEGFALYDVTGTKGFLIQSEISINYTVEGTLCAHKEVINWAHIINACTNCVSPNKSSKKDAASGASS